MFLAYTCGAARPNSQLLLKNTQLDLKKIKWILVFIFQISLTANGMNEYSETVDLAATADHNIYTVQYQVHDFQFFILFQLCFASKEFKC